jgi:hypothetical protein
MRELTKLEWGADPIYGTERDGILNQRCFKACECDDVSFQG